MKNYINNKTTDRFRAVYHDGQGNIIKHGTPCEVARMLSDSVNQVWDGPFSYTSHDRMIDGAWISIDEVRC